MEKMPVKRGMKCKRYVVMSDECGRKYIEKIDADTKQKKKVYLDEIEKLKKCGVKCVKNSFQEDVVESHDSEEESISSCEKEPVKKHSKKQTETDSSESSSSDSSSQHITTKHKMTEVVRLQLPVLGIELRMFRFL